MDEEFMREMSWGMNHPNPDHYRPQKRPNETFSGAVDGEDKMGNEYMYLNFDPTGMMVPYHSGTSQAIQSPNTSSTPHLTRSASARISDPEKAEKKKRIDQAYREKCKRMKLDMQINLEILTVENDSLKKENESLKKANASMNQTLKDQAKEIDRLRNDLSQLKREWEKQNVLVQTLSGLIADPVQLENEKLKDENASLRKNADVNHNLLLEENSKLKLENKVLRVQNDALCGKIINDNDIKHITV
ncbi:hypothetical protein CCACVL1_29899 [Corchorus capsularis]|uniref:BZIP domain-containing protein n=1 Tax=Corchorus capsularis TaxID=210143 RepID=A0A1R3FZJ9_COCAP|nr:hypothetical protein CCACVL1_29899 [Corchorus capsularis]